MNMLGKANLLIGRYGGHNGKTLANGDWEQKKIYLLEFLPLFFWLARGRR